MDKSVFGPLEHYWKEQVLLFYDHSTDRTFTKQRFGKIFTEARDKAGTPANNKAGFHATGIYPFNPSFLFLQSALYVFGLILNFYCFK
jgi:hypothetical protein